LIENTGVCSHKYGNQAIDAVQGNIAAEKKWAMNEPSRRSKRGQKRAWTRKSITDWSISWCDAKKDLLRTLIWVKRVSARHASSRADVDETGSTTLCALGNIWKSSVCDILLCHIMSREPRFKISERSCSYLTSEVVRTRNMPASTPQCYVLLAHFDIDRGSIIKAQYPQAMGVPERYLSYFAFSLKWMLTNKSKHCCSYLAELMLPEGAHLRPSDSTIFFLKKSVRWLELYSCVLCISNSLTNSGCRQINRDVWRIIILSLVGQDQNQHIRSSWGGGLLVGSLFTASLYWYLQTSVGACARPVSRHGLDWQDEW
jgi:hypothetical protein